MEPSTESLFHTRFGLIPVMRLRDEIRCSTPTLRRYLTRASIVVICWSDSSLKNPYLMPFHSWAAMPSRFSPNMTMTMLRVFCEISSFGENPSCLLTAGFLSHSAQAFIEFDVCMVVRAKSYDDQIEPHTLALQTADIAQNAHEFEIMAYGPDETVRN